MAYPMTHPDVEAWFGNTGTTIDLFETSPILNNGSLAIWRMSCGQRGKVSPR